MPVGSHPSAHLDHLHLWLLEWNLPWCHCFLPSLPALGSATHWGAGGFLWCSWGCSGRLTCAPTEVFPVPCMSKQPLLDSLDSVISQLTDLRAAVATTGEEGSAETASSAGSFELVDSPGLPAELPGPTTEGPLPAGTAAPLIVWTPAWDQAILTATTPEALLALDLTPLRSLEEGCRLRTVGVWTSFGRLARAFQCGRAAHLAIDRGDLRARCRSCMASASSVNLRVTEDLIRSGVSQDIKERLSTVFLVDTLSDPYQWRCQVFLLRVRAHGFMCLLPADPSVQRALASVEESIGITEKCVLTEVEVDVESAKGKALGTISMFIADFPWGFLGMFRKVQLRASGSTPIYSFRFGNALARPNVTSAEAVADRWITEVLDADTARDYTTAEEGGERGDGASEEFAEPTGGRMGDIESLHVRIAQLESLLSLAAEHLRLCQPPLQQIWVVKVFLPGLAEKVCPPPIGQSCTELLELHQKGLQEQNVQRQLPQESIQLWRHFMPNKIEKLATPMQRTSWRRSSHPVFKLCRTQHIAY